MFCQGLFVRRIRQARMMLDGELYALVVSHREQTARVRRWVRRAAVLLVAVLWLLVVTAPQSRAYPTCDGGYQVGTPWGGYCDGFPEVSGQHWHCQWGLGFSLCEWRWGDNTVAPNPYIDTRQAYA
jgi:hypothetical protein